MTTPTSMGNHGGTVTSCSPYAHPGFAEICILLRTWSTVALGTYEPASLLKKLNIWAFGRTKDPYFGILGAPRGIMVTPSGGFDF